MENNVIASRQKEQPGDDFWNGDCPKCKGTMASPDMGQVHLDHGEFIAVTQECNECGYKVESFYDWDRTEKAG